MRIRVITQEFKREGTRVSVAGIRALVCVKCGEIYFPPGGAQALVESSQWPLRLGPPQPAPEKLTIGCLALTEPGHGSDTVTFTEPHFASPSLRANCSARCVGIEWIAPTNGWIEALSVTSLCFAKIIWWSCGLGVQARVSDLTELHRCRHNAAAIQGDPPAA